MCVYTIAKGTVVVCSNHILAKKQTLRVIFALRGFRILEVAVALPCILVSR